MIKMLRCEDFHLILKMIAFVKIIDKDYNDLVLSYSQNLFDGEVNMPECECLPKCIFFNDKMQDKPLTAEMMKNRLCKSDFEQCARFRVFKALGRENVPADLYPNQIERADKLLMN